MLLNQTKHLFLECVLFFFFSDQLILVTYSICRYPYICDRPISANTGQALMNTSNKSLLTEVCISQEPFIWSNLYMSEDPLKYWIWCNFHTWHVQYQYILNKQRTSTLLWAAAVWDKDEGWKWEMFSRYMTDLSWERWHYFISHSSYELVTSQKSCSQFDLILQKTRLIC